MPVWGEETIPVDIFQGLRISEVKSDTYCSEFNNVVKVEESELTVREDLVWIQAPTATYSRAIPTTSPIPRNIGARDLEVFTAVGSPTADSPSLLMFLDDATILNCTWLNCNSLTPSSIVQTCTATHGVKAFVQVRDRYYGSNGSNKIFQISGFTTAATPLVFTDIAAVGVNHLLAFKNRVFGFTGNRIYYTDLPGIGLYPDVWNLVTNFIDLPSLDFSVTIHNVRVYKDKIYMFTDKGIYYLQANGDPVNWSVQLISANFPIYDRDSICINKNLIFLTDQSNLYSFDGSNFKKIQNASSLFYDVNGSSSGTSEFYSIVNVYPYEEGIAVVKQAYAGIAGNYSTLNNYVYYYDLSVWSTLSVNVNAPGSIDTATGTLKIGTNLTPYRGTYASSKSGPVARCLFLDTGKWLGDRMSTTVGAARVTKYFRIVSPVVKLKSRFFTKIKGLVMYAKFNLADTVSMALNGDAMAIADQQAASVNEIRIRMSTTGGQFIPQGAAWVTISGDVTPDRTNAGIIPALRIFGIDAIANLDQRGPSEKIT